MVNGVRGFLLDLCLRSGHLLPAAACPMVRASEEQRVINENAVIVSDERASHQNGELRSHSVRSTLEGDIDELMV